MTTVKLILERIISVEDQKTAGYHACYVYHHSLLDANCASSLSSDWTTDKNEDWHLQNLASKVTTMLYQRFNEATISIELQQNPRVHWKKPYISALCHEGDGLKLLGYIAHVLVQNRETQTLAP